MHGDCGACGAPSAPLKCTCLAEHYCNQSCQKAQFKTHKAQCTIYLLKSIVKKSQVLRLLQAQTSSAGRASSAKKVEGEAHGEQTTKEQELAQEHHTVGYLISQTSNYPGAEEHYKKALHFHHNVEASIAMLD